MFKSKEKKQPPRKGRQNVLNFMGYDGSHDDTDDDDMEQQLAALMGEGGGPKPKKKAPPKLIDWSIIDEQVKESMKDVDEDGDEDVTEDDENELMGELADLVGDDEPDLLHPGPASSRNRSPSPQPQNTGGMVELLQSRKTMYETAVKNAAATGQSSKVRRLQRGMKTLDELLRSAKKGKTISEDDIPPVVAGGQASGPAAPPPTSSTDAAPKEEKAPSPPKVLPKPSAPSKTEDVPTKEIDPKTLNVLEERKQEYKLAALHAKRNGDKAAALQHFKVIKQFDAVIQAAKDGQTIDLSEMPPSLKGVPQKEVVPKAESQPVISETMQSSDEPSTSSAAAPAPQPSAPSKPKTVLEALEQRMQKYQASSQEATKEGNGGKARRMGRIVKQYQTAIRSHKAGKSVNFDELPVPPGFPPIPGVKDSAQDVDIMQKASTLIRTDPDDEPGPSVSADQHLGKAFAGPQPSTSRTGKSPSPQPQKRTSSKSPANAYEQQVAFLENRQAAFKRAALDAKRRGDKTAAVDYLRKMKGFDNMIEAAKNGLKVDIRNVPQPPKETMNKDDDFEMIDAREVRSSSSSSRGKSASPEEDNELYSRLLSSLQEQVKKARAYAQQMTHAGDVAGAERSDRLASSSQADYDYVRSCQRHHDPPPHFFYENMVFNTVHIIADLGSNDMELLLVQCMDLHAGGKEAKYFIEWEFPFPHENPLKGRSEESKDTSQNPKFDAHFRVPFNRKLKSYQRAIKSKAVKLEVFQKGGFLRSDKSVGSASVKLAPLESHCEVHAVEELKENRNSVGKIEAYVRLRTPLLGSDSQSIKERWLRIEHRKHHSRPDSDNTGGSLKAAPPKPSARASNRKVNIASIEVLNLELKIAQAKLSNHKQRGTTPPSDVLREAKTIKDKLTETKKFLQEGGQHAKTEYCNCLKAQYQHLTAEAQAYAKQGKKEQAKLALTKKAYIQKELAKYSS